MCSSLNVLVTRQAPDFTATTLMPDNTFNEKFTRKLQGNMEVS